MVDVLEIFSILVMPYSLFVICRWHEDLISDDLVVHSSGFHVLNKDPNAIVFIPK